MSKTTLDPDDWDHFRSVAHINTSIVFTLQELGIAAPSTTVLHDKVAIRVSITNHRTEIHDLDMLFEKAEEIGDQISGQSRFL